MVQTDIMKPVKHGPLVNTCLNTIRSRTAPPADLAVAVLGFNPRYNSLPDEIGSLEGNLCSGLYLLTEQPSSVQSRSKWREDTVVINIRYSISRSSAI